MPSYQFNECVDDGLNNMIVVTGIYRSGTTITGKVIGSFKDIEYAYDPPLLFHLAYLRHLDRVKDSELLNLVKIYLYYDYYLNYLHGRYNLRIKDEGSCVLHMKPCKEVLEKLFAVDSVEHAFSRDSNDRARFSFKFCNLYDLLELLVDEYPKIKVVDMKRDLKRVLASMMAKKWFFDESLKDDNTVLWPFYALDGYVKTPYIVNESDLDLWNRLNNVSRTAYMCCKLAEKKIRFRDFIINNEKHGGMYLELKYEEFIANPIDQVRIIYDFTGAACGDMTSQVVNTIKPSVSKCDINEFSKECDPDIWDRLIELNNSLGYS